MVVDDHDLLREGLITLLSAVMDFDVIGQTSNGKETLSFLEDYRPDVILLDVDMPIMNGRETLMKILSLYPHIKVIMLTMHGGMAYESTFMTLGSHSFLVKNTNSDEIIKAIRSVIKGRYYYSTIPQTINVEAICEKHLQLSLNEREREILEFICDNKTNKFISESLKLSENTIRYYRKNIYSKTRTNSITDLVKYSIRNGIISVE